MRLFTKAITSLTNDRVKMIRSLEMSKERKKTGLFVVEGASIILTADAAGFKPYILVYGAGRLETEVQKSIIQKALEGGSEVLQVSSKILEKISSKSNPQSMLAVFRQRWSSLRDIVPNPKNLYLVLEQVRDPGNLGTIQRTAEAVGASCIILLDNCCDPYLRESVRASMGSIFKVPLIALKQKEFLAWLRNFPGDVIATLPTAHEDFRQVEYKFPVVLLMGNESSGLTQSLVDIASKIVKIPMLGTLDSLNLAVSTGLMLYQLKRDCLKI